MAQTVFAPYNTRPHWSGENADLSVHLEAYDGLVDGSFRTGSMFREMGLTTYKSVENRTNTWRGDRIGAAQVLGRRSGDEVKSARMVNEKLLIVVDTTSYIRSPIDYQDDWTAPAFMAEYSEEHGSAHAKAFDQAHLIQLIKTGNWKAPVSLKKSGAFNDGLSYTLTGYSAAVGVDNEKAADIIVQKHKDAIAEFVMRDIGQGGISEMVTLIDPFMFNVLSDHKRLMNVQFQGNQGWNNFAQRRVAVLNGIVVAETPRFPQVAIPDHHLGPGFNVTAAEAKAKMILFNPRKTLITVEAKPMETRVWDDQKEFNNILDTYCMYTVGVRRGDATAVFSID